MKATVELVCCSDGEILVGNALTVWFNSSVFFLICSSDGARIVKLHDLRFFHAKAVRLIDVFFTV